MKTHSINLTSSQATAPVTGNINTPAKTRHMIKTGASGLEFLTWQLARLFTATVAGLAILVSTAWLITQPQLDNYLQASIWAAGFVFLALSVEAAKPWRLLLTGLTLPAVALVSYNIAVEWAMLAAAIVATWAVYAIYKK